MKLLLFFTMLSFSVVKAQHQINFILEVDEKVVNRRIEILFEFKNAHGIVDSVLGSYIIGELDLPSIGFSELKKIHDTDTVHVVFYDLVEKNVNSFYLEKQYLFQRYLYVKFFSGRLKNGKCGFEYECPINSTKLAVRFKKLLWWRKVKTDCD